MRVETQGPAARLMRERSETERVETQGPAARLMRERSETERVETLGPASHFINEIRKDVEDDPWFKDEENQKYYEKGIYMKMDTTGLYLNTVADMILADNGSPTFIDFMVNKVKVSQYAVNPDDFEGLRDYLSTNSYLETALRSQSPLSILNLDLSFRSQIIDGMPNQELHDLMVMKYGSTVNFANSVLLNDPCFDVMSLAILTSEYYNFASALLGQANPTELQALWDFYFYPTAMPWDMNQVADEFFNTFDLDIYNKILALDWVKDNFFMTYELHFGFGSLETYLVGYSDFKLCTRNALTDAGLIGIYNMHDQIGLWDAMNLHFPWELLADKMTQYNPDAFLLAGLGYLPQYATQMLESGMPIAIGPGVWQPLYQISLEQFFDSIRTYPGLGEAYMLQLTNQLIASGYASPGWSYAVGEHHIYGSSRLGIHQTKKELRNRYKQEEIFIPSNTVNTTALYRGKRNYELSNHLGNVNVVITDKRKSVCDEELGVEYFVSEVLSGVDYYPFGKILPDRQWYASNDTCQLINGFNGMRYDHEVNQKGRSVDYGARILDVDLGRWMSVDPMMNNFPEISPYSFAENNPIYFIDEAGEKPIPTGRLLDRTKPHIKYEYRKEIINNQEVYFRRAHYFNVLNMPHSNSNERAWKAITVNEYKGGVKWRLINKGTPNPIIYTFAGDYRKTNLGSSISYEENIGRNTDLEVSIKYQMDEAYDRVTLEYYDENEEAWLSAATTGFVKGDGSLTLNITLPENSKIRIKVDQPGRNESSYNNFLVEIKTKDIATLQPLSDNWNDNWVNDFEFDPLKVSRKPTPKNSNETTEGKENHQTHEDD